MTTTNEDAGLLTDEQILAIAAPHFEVSESRFGREFNPHDQYHGSDLSTVAFARAIESEVRAALAPSKVQGEAVRANEGFALVPLEPTDAMQLAGAQAVRMDTTVINKIWTANAVFRAMVAAAASGGEKA
ncbi:MAG: hypothetical protein OSB38_21180 [Paraburkholderia fungorum]|nr:hypothetical protein [Paraburkholderia fungorum]